MPGAIGLLLIITAIAFSSFISYDGNMSRASRGTLGVILLSMVSAFVFSLLGDISSFVISPPELEPGDSAAAIGLMEDAFEKGIGDAIADRFSLDRDEILVVCKGYDVETQTAKDINVKLSGKARFSDIPAVRRYAEGLGLAKEEVTVELERDK